MPITVLRRSPTPPGGSPAQQPIDAKPEVIGDVPPMMPSQPGPVITSAPSNMLDEDVRVKDPDADVVEEPAQPALPDPVVTGEDTGDAEDSAWVPKTPTLPFPATPWVPKTPAIAAPITPAAAESHKKTTVIRQGSPRTTVISDAAPATPKQRNNAQVFGGAGLVALGLGGLGVAGYQLWQLNAMQRKLANKKLLTPKIQAQLAHQRNMIILKALGLGIGGTAAVVGGGALIHRGLAASAA